MILTSVILTRTSVEMQECDFDTYECDYNTHEFEGKKIYFDESFFLKFQI
jgi:hypothetical protein